MVAGAERGVPEEIWRGAFNGAEELRIRYRKTAEELFLKNFILPQREFCRRNGLFYTGHLSCDEGPFQNSIGHFSSPFRYLKMLDIPAIDDYLCDSATGTIRIIWAAASRKRRTGT